MHQEREEERERERRQQISINKPNSSHCEEQQQFALDTRSSIYTWVIFEFHRGFAKPSGFLSDICQEGEDVEQAEKAMAQRDTPESTQASLPPSRHAATGFLTGDANILIITASSGKHLTSNLVHPSSMEYQHSG